MSADTVPKEEKIKSLSNAIISNIVFAAITVVVQIVVFAALARFLTPSDYGLFGFANAILIYIAHLSQRGLVASLVRQNRMQKNDYGTAYAMCVVFAVMSIVIITGICVLIRTLNSSRLDAETALLLFMSIPLALQILSSPAIAYLQRRLDFFTLNIVQLLSFVVGNGFVTVSLSLFGYGPWSLAIGAATYSVVSLVSLLAVTRRTLISRWHSGPLLITIKEALHFNVLRSLDVAWVHLPTILIGTMTTPAATGIYQRMQFLVDLGYQMTVWRVTSVVYAALARSGSTGAIDKTKYRRTLTLCSAMVLPAMAYLFTGADAIVPVILGPQWISGTTTLQLLGVAFGLSTLNHAASMALEHAGFRLRRVMPSLIAIATLLICFYLAYVMRIDSFALPALLSMMSSSIAMHVAVGERIRDVPSLMSDMLPGIVLGLSVGASGLLAQTLTSSLAPLLYMTLHLSFCATGAYLAALALSRTTVGKTHLDALIVVLPMMRPLLTRGLFLNPRYEQ